MRRAPSFAARSLGGGVGMDVRSVAASSCCDEELKQMAKHQRPMHRYPVLDSMTKGDALSMASILKRALTTAEKENSERVVALIAHYEQYLAGCRLNLASLLTETWDTVLLLVSKVLTCRHHTRNRCIICQEASA